MLVRAKTYFKEQDFKILRREQGSNQSPQFCRAFDDYKNQILRVEPLKVPLEFAYVPRLSVLNIQKFLILFASDHSGCDSAVSSKIVDANDFRLV